MRILLLTQLFQPEPNHLKGLEFAKRMQCLGHHVEVLTGYPNYPGGTLYPGYKIRFVQHEVIEGVSVTRVAMFPSHDTSAIRRMLTYLSLAVTASLIGPLRFRDIDIIHLDVGPISLVIPAALIALVSRARLVVDVQDLWPESAVSSGMVKGRFLVGMLNGLASFSYRVADSIIVLSEGYREILVKRGVPRDKIRVIYNWCDESQIQKAVSPCRELQALHDAGKKVVMYAGTMGPVQALDHVLDAASLLRTTHPHIHFVFVGDGIECERLKQRSMEESLTNVSFVPQVPASRIASVLQTADLLLVHLRRDLLGSVAIPQKTQAYLATGKPILMAVRGEASKIVERAGAGRMCPPEDAERIASAVADMLGKPSEQLQEMGRAGREYYQMNMSFGTGVKEIEQLYAEVVH
jgi:glycosyltransferase involved in cell wall biosynthesis